MVEAQAQPSEYDRYEEDTIDIIEQSLSRKIDTLKKEIAELYADIRNRKDLHKDTAKELNSLVKNRHIQLNSFPKGNAGWGSYFESNIASLEKEISDLKREKRLEKVGCWRNRSKLKKELRKLLKEYESLVKRKEFLKECIAKEKN